MDLSKLPKLSQTAEAAKAQGAATPEGSVPRVDPPAAAPVPAYREEMVVGAEVWISFVMGVIFLWVGGTFGRYLLARLTGGEFHTHVDWLEGSPKAGQEVGYFELQGYTAWTDASLFLFGAAMIADGLILLASGGGRRTWVVWAGLTLTLIAVVTNLITVVLVMSSGVLPLMSLVAVAIGGYMAAYQWKLAAGGRA